MLYQKIRKPLFFDPHQNHLTQLSPTGSFTTRPGPCVEKFRELEGDLGRTMKILLIDDDPLTHQAVSFCVQETHEVFSAYSFEEGTRILKEEAIAFVLIDLHFKNIERKGSDFLRMLRISHPGLPAVMVSGDQSIDRVVECIRLGADDYISKPFSGSDLTEKIDAVLEKRRKRKEYPVTETINKEEVLIGQCSSVLAAKSQITRAREMRLLIVGETGVGKTPFAKYSNLSLDPSGKRPFEQINCASLSRERFQDELFGHKKGAFTSAIADKKGLVELAEGGDLFLDEIGEMPLEVQALFLTFLDSMEYYRLGEDKKRRADVRIICATNRDLKQMVIEGRFRKDLYSRVSQVVVDVPPLRERKEDIPELFEFFIRDTLGFQKKYDPEVLGVLIEYPWREGNVREFRDAVEYLCVVSSESDRIRVEHLADRFQSSGHLVGVGSTDVVDPMHADHLRNDPASAESSHAKDEIYNVGLETYLTEVEKKLLRDLYEAHGGNVNELANRIRVSRSTLYRRLKKSGVLS